MNHVFTIYSIFFLATALVSFFVAFLAWQRRLVKGAKELSLLMVAVGLGAFCLIFETATSILLEKIFWSKLEYFGGIAAPVCYFIFALRFTGKDKFLSARHVLLLFFIPAVTYILVLTNERHNLIWSGFSAISGKTNLIEYYHGLGFWIGYIVYSYILLFIATVYLYSFILHQIKTFRFQGFIVLAGGLFPWITSVCYVTGINIVPGLDITPVSISLSGILLVYAIVYAQFLDLVPIARETLVETLSDGILALDKQNRIQDINQAALLFLGVSKKNVIGYPVKSSGATNVFLLNAVTDSESVDQIEVNTDGNIKFFRIIKQTIKNQAGSRLIVIRDITVQIIRQREIQAGEERYRSMFTMFRLMSDNMQDMLWAKDLEKRFIFTNKTFCENILNATDIDEPLGKTHLYFAQRERLKYPEQPDWYTFGELCQDYDQVVINSRKQEHFDESGYINGKFFFLDVRKAPIFNEKGIMIGIVGSARDVTQQKRIVLELEKRDKLLNAIANATAILVQGDNLDENIIATLETIGNAIEVSSVYIFQSFYDREHQMPLMSQRYEWTEGKVEPKVNKGLQKVSYEYAYLGWFETLSEGNVVVGNIRDFPVPAKTALELQGIKSILITPIFIDKKFWGFIEFDDCVHERVWLPTEERILAAAANTIGAAYLRKKNQDELVVAKERAEESDHLKSAFLANMSHEIRTPMNGILGFADLLKEKGLTDEEQLMYIDIIRKSGVRMLNIINDLIDISKVESGQMEVNITACNINEQIEYIYIFFKPEVEKKGMELFYKNELPTEKAIINTDREKIYAILTNLVKNAIKYSDEGMIEFGYHLSDELVEPVELTFYVKDTGIGIPYDKQEAIFDRFVQADITDEKALQGAGLGLSITKAYVEMLGGKIWVESQEKDGSTFYFTLPYSFETQIL